MCIATIIDKTTNIKFALIKSYYLRMCVVTEETGVRKTTISATSVSH